MLKPEIILIHGGFAVLLYAPFLSPWFHSNIMDTELLIHNSSFITCCLLLCSSGMLEHGATKSRNKRTRKERWLLLATKFNLLQTSLETSPSCDCQVNGRRVHGWLLLYGSFWLEQQSICKHEELLRIWNRPFASFPNTDPWFDKTRTPRGAANMALPQNALRQDRTWWIAFVILAVLSTTVAVPEWPEPFVTWRWFFAGM